MKKITLIFLFIAGTMFHAFAQKGEFQIRLGLGGSGNSTESEIKYHINGLTFSDTNKDGAVTVHMPLELRYHVSNRFNIGLDMKFGSYVYDPDSAEGKSNHFNVLGIAAEYSIISMDHLRWYVGLGFTGASLELQEENNDGLLYSRAVANYSGGGARLNTGLLVLIGNHFGVNFNLGFDNHNFKLQKYTLNGDVIDEIDGTLKTRGVDGTLGLVVRL